MNVTNMWFSFIKNIQDNAESIFTRLLETALVLIMASLAVRFGRMIITKFFHKQKNFKYSIDDKRADTLSTLLGSVYKYVIYAVAILTIVNTIFGINLSTLITAAGLGTVVFGIWGQSLVKDIIAGFFILLEDQFAVGDSITVDEMTGTVEEIEMRITKIRHFNGDLLIISNGEIKRVINHTRGNKLAIVDVKVSYEENLDRVIGILHKTSEEFSKESEVVVEEPKVLGVTEFTATDINVRVIVRTLPNEHVAVERELRKRIKEAFDNEGIKIPYTRPNIDGSSEMSK